MSEDKVMHGYSGRLHLLGCCIIESYFEALNVVDNGRKGWGYSKDKIQENLECEIFDVCLNEAKEAGHKVIVFNATKALNMNKISKALI